MKHFFTVLKFFLTLRMSNAQENQIEKSGNKSFALLVKGYEGTIEFYTKKTCFRFSYRPEVLRKYALGQFNSGKY